MPAKILSVEKKPSMKIPKLNLGLVHQDGALVAQSITDAKLPEFQIE